MAPRPVYEGQPYYSFDDVVNSFSFWDVLDIFNPLQHIPLVGSIYRELTGDTITGFAQVAGGALFGGPIGAGVGVVSMALSETAGGDATQIAMGAVGSLFGDDPAVAGGDANVASAPLGGTLLTGEADATQLASAGSGAARGPFISSLDRDGAHTSVFARSSAPSSAAMLAAASPPPTGTVALAGTPSGAGAPLGGQLLADAFASGLAGRADAPAGSTGDILTLNSAQSAALAAFVSQNGGAPRGGGDPAGRTAAGSVALAAADGAGRSAIPAAAPSSPDTQSEDMTQTPNQNFSGGASDRDSGRQSSEPAMPESIRRGREAQRLRLAQAQAQAQALAAAQAAQSQGQSQAEALAQVPAGPASGSTTPDNRPTGMTLADYRARPNRQVETARTRASAERSHGTVGAGGGRALAGVLPDAATMAGLMERGETLATVAARQGERVAQEAAQAVTPPVHGAGDLDFRAMPLTDTASASTTPDRAAHTRAAPTRAIEASAPVAMQPWFSDRVMDAMRRYDALRDAETPTS
ncbi:hypothetical protein F1188_06645 [Roseospira marina]|uniref:Uncharacterized protein n=1 Tax=Roseospira marina TaxID=140057 RepID=A0A5M6IE65_9PROT|nr:hypothetical protein [Roseospira marina]KAA5606534.1 hypothetical protein F1188_06645 [Roseospira marina]